MEVDYANAHISVGEFKKSINPKYNVYQYEKRRFRNIKLYDHQLFLKAAQNLHLMQTDINFARNSIAHQEIAINQISSIVSCIQKEVNLYELEENYNTEVQKLREGYKKKVDTYKEKIDFANQSNLSMLAEINHQAEEAEKEANELTLAGREQTKREFDNDFENQNKLLKKQLKEAQNELTELQALSDKAAIARKRIDDYNSMKNQQKRITSKIGGGVALQQAMKQKAVLSSSRVADQFRSYHEKNKKTSRGFFPQSF